MWNCKGYARAKAEEIGEEEEGRDADVFLFVETWCLPGCQVEAPEGYEVHNLARTWKKERGRPGGGVAVTVRHGRGICASTVKESEEGDRLWVRLEREGIRGEDLYLCVCYLGPGMEREREEVFFDDLTEEVMGFGGKGRVLVAGDFNARTGEGEDFIGDEEREQLGEEVRGGWGEAIRRKSCDEVVNARGRKLLEVCKVSGLGIVNGRTKGDGKGEKTFVGPMGGSSLVDYFLVDFETWDQVRDMKVLPTCLSSDHRPLALDLRRGEKGAGGEQGRDEGGGKGKRWRFDQRRWEEYKEALERKERRARLRDIEMGKYVGKGAAEELHRVIVEAAEEVFGYAVKGEKREFPVKGWFDDECKKAKRGLREWVERAGRDSELVRAREKEYRRLLRRKRRRWSEAENACLLELAKKNPSKFWRRFKRRKGQVMVKSVREWEDYCRKLYGLGGGEKDKGGTEKGLAAETQADEMEEADIAEGADEADGEGTQVMETNIKTEEVEAALARMKTRKAADIDFLVVELLRAGVLELLTGPLTAVFNEIFTTGHFPSRWNVGLLHPIFKKGDPEKCENYRTVTVISLFGKLFASILEARISEWAEEKGCRAKGQAGFRKGRSTVDHLFTLKALIDKARGGSKNELYCCFVDFSKAFDTVPRGKLWERLREIGLGRKMGRAVQALYENVRCRVVTPEGLSGEFPSLMGVKQGCPLSPLLFGLYIDELENYLLETKETGAPELGGERIPALMYADDVALMSRTKKGMQRMLKTLEAFCDKKQLSVNLGKTKIVVFRANVKKQKREAREDPYLYKQQAIEVVEGYNYLGLELHATGRFHNAVEALVVKAKRAAFVLQQRCRELGVSDPYFKLQLFDVLVTPVLYYGCEVWGPLATQKQKESVERIQRSFVRELLRLRKSTPSMIMLAEVGRFPLEIGQWKRVVKFYNRVMEREDNDIVKRAMLDAKVKCTQGQTTWFGNLIERVNCNRECFGIEGVEAGKIDFDMFVQDIEGGYLKAFQNQTGSKMVMYQSLKASYVGEEYLRRMPVTPALYELLKFRCGSHDLEIEKGRYRGVPRDQRICTNCNLGRIEDEAHFLFECPRYYVVRGQYHFLFEYANRDVSRFVNHPEREVVGHLLLDCARLRL